MNENFFSSQKRILAAFQLKKPDRVPVVLFGVNPYAPYSDDWARRDSRYKRVLQEAVEKTDIFFWDSFPQFYAHCINGYREESPVEKDGSVFVEQWIDTPRGQLHSLVRQDKGINTAWRVEPFIKNEEDLKKFQSVGLHPYNQQTVQEFRQTYFYNQERPHQSLNYKTPAEMYFDSNNQEKKFDCILNMANSCLDNGVHLIIKLFTITWTTLSELPTSIHNTMNNIFISFRKLTSKEKIFKGAIKDKSGPLSGANRWLS